jgi:hypothetical protein
MIALLVSGCCLAQPFAAQTQTVPRPGLPPRGGTVVGTIDGIRLEGGQLQISGWACQRENSASITVMVYADRSAANTPKGRFVLSGSANIASEPAVARACHDNAGGKHRFRIDLSNQLLTTYQGHKLFMNGVRATGIIDKSPLGGSGTLQFPKPPAAYPALSGGYANSAQHPRVFMTNADLRELVTRINTSGTFSARSFARLAASVKTDLAAKIDWDATYSGCDLDIYLRAFSIEERRGYAGEVRTDDQLRAAMNVQPGAVAPAGAAPVASRSALYAALVRAGAVAPADAPSVDQAAALAKRILLAWAKHGFRDAKGRFRNAVAQFCDDKGHSDPGVQSGVGLQIGRGIIYSTHAQDLLQSIDAFTAAEARELNSFHTAMFDLLLRATNFRFALQDHPSSQCEAYSNHVAAALKAMLSVARLLDDSRRFTAVLNGSDPSIPVSLPWIVYFNHAIYGENDTPIACAPNTGPDSLTSHPSFQTPTVAAGEMEDRYRNANPAQAIGYTAGNLKGIFDAAELLRASGFDLYGYRGARRQSIEMAAQYYACYAGHAGFYKTITAENSAACPNYQQYVGHVVNEVEPSILIGAYRFPKNVSLTSLDSAAKTAWASTANAVDTIRFGRWRD